MQEDSIFGQSLGVVDGVVGDDYSYHMAELTIEQIERLDVLVRDDHIVLVQQVLDIFEEYRSSFLNRYVVTLGVPRVEQMS